jgi:outer membrane protein OmpA-like peptidoglycan-associated protein
MEVEARNLPPVASTGSVPEGRAENQRVEIHSDTPEILDTITSTFVEEMSNTEVIQIVPQITSGYDIAHWTVELRGDGVQIDAIEGTGGLLPSYTFDVHEIGAARLGAYETLQATVEVTDKKGQSHRATGQSSVRFIKREERVAQKMGYKVVEKYALILFDFDSAEIKTRNKAVLDRIVERIKGVPNAMVRIVGHTDTIGKEAYNIELSARRAKAAYDQLLAGGATALSITYRGVGPYEPLYDNSLPEGRALNRTVTVTLEYEAVE